MNLIKRLLHYWRMWRRKGAARMPPSIWLHWVLFSSWPLAVIEARSDKTDTGLARRARARLAPNPLISHPITKETT